MVLAGFSQGSQAITQALAQTDTPQRLAGAILVGNPDHYPGQNVQEVSGDADQSAIGMTSTRPVEVARWSGGSGGR